MEKSTANVKVRNGPGSQGKRPLLLKVQRESWGTGPSHGRRRARKDRNHF